MSRLLCLSAFVATFAAAAPRASDVAKRFPPLSLPASFSDAKALTVKLSAADVEALGFLKQPAVPDGLKRWTATPDEGETQTLWAVGLAKVGTSLLLVVRFDDSLPMSDSKETFALALTGETVKGGALVHAAVSSEAGGATMTSTLGADGAISRAVRTEIPVHEEGLPEAMVVTLDESQKLRADGTWEASSSSATTQRGKFVDAKSKEELWIFDGAVFYRGNESKPFQKLDFDGKAVRFKGSKTPYSLTWDATKKSIACVDPKGKAQTFTREW